MLVLFDNSTPRTRARYLLEHHTITEARARGWGRLENGDLLNAAEAARVLSAPIQAMIDEILVAVSQQRHVPADR